MIFLAMIVLLAGIVALVVRTKFDLPEIRFGGTLVAIGGLAGGAVLAAGSALTVIPAGHVGVPVIFGKVQDVAKPEGLHLVNPFAVVEKLSVRTETYTMSVVHTEGKMTGDDSIRALSKDGLALPMDITMAYHLVEKDAPWVYRSLGINYADTILRPAARTAIRDATSMFTFQECYSTKRQELSQTMEDILVKRIKDLIARRGGDDIAGFAVDQVMLRNVEPPAKVKNSIEEKLAAEQDAQRMEFILLKEKKEAERKRIEAEGVRDFQRIVMEGINADYLTWKGIETTGQLAASPNAKIVVIGAGDKGLPLILGGN